MDTPQAVTQAPTQPAPMVPPQVVTTPPTQSAPTTGQSSSSGSFQDTFKKAVSNPVQLGFGILVSAALFYTIYYFRYKVQFQKVFVANVENKIDELDMKYADVLSKLNNQTEVPQENLQQLFF
jgi:hypothetical protein